MQQEFVREIVARLENLGLVYAISGSVASNFWGIPRLTHDVDILVVLTESRIKSVMSAFADPYYISEQAMEHAVRSRSMFNVIETTSGYKVDFWISPGDPFSQSLLSRRLRVAFMPDQEAFFASPEDVLLHKLVWNKITPSERQLADAAGIAAVQVGRLNVDYLNHWASHQSTSADLAAVLQGKHLKQT